ncbi:hypothetical protein [Reichenbachiella versicolor]|nr:hypothetical protein [Reichenbachiella versicolor]
MLKLYNQAPALEKTLKALFNMLTAHRQIAGTPELDTAFNELSTLVNSY